MTKDYVTWNDIDKAVAEIVDWAKGQYFENVYGIPRGGLIPAIMLSHRLGLPLTTNPEKHKTLVVDDIVDSGETMEDFTHYKTVSLYYNAKSKFKPLFHVHEVKNWIVFPWETDQSSKVDYKEKDNET